ncbi:MAG: hydrogenase maturation protease [Candidatus Bipolaricaulota bacterium]|nr:MAG: hydrogenase maturation protease [Candidatus Bipolaricaulota bacterium]
MIAERDAEILPDHCAAEVVVLCCGNVLLGDDGFGPAVAAALHASSRIPERAAVVDAGTAVRELLFDILVCDRRPRQLVLVDAVDVGRDPGEVFELELDRFPKVNVATLSLHQAPTTHLLREIRDETGVEVTAIVCQIAQRTEEVEDRLSPAVLRAVAAAADLIRRRFLDDESAKE